MKLARCRSLRFPFGGTGAVCAVLAAILVIVTHRPAAGADFSVSDFVFSGVSTFTAATTDLGPSNQTNVYRADLGAALSALDGNFAAVSHVAIRDANSQTGSDGVFCGFDLDFLLFDNDGVLNGNEFGVINSTLINAGGIEKAATSPYQPTTLHPGPLFGTNVSGQLDAATATLGTLDANFQPGTGTLSVDTSGGWVSLGDIGWIIGTVQNVTYNAGENLYLFVGDAGKAGENMEVFVQAALVLDPDGPYLIANGETLFLDANQTPMNQGIITWTWRIDGVEVPGAYTDGNAPWNAQVPFQYLLDNVYDPNNPLHDHVIELEVLTSDGRGGIDTSSLTFAENVPEPATVTLLSVAALLLRRRRRRS